MPQSLKQAARRRGEAGQLLPVAFKALHAIGADMRRGHLYMEAAAPGIGKSIKALNEILFMKIPTLYISMDGDAHTDLSRLVQSVALVDSVEAERQVKDSGPLARNAFDAVTWLRYDFCDRPDTTEIAHRVWAYAEIEGRWPELIVIDNLMDVAYDEASEGAGLNQVMDDLASLARKTQAAVKVLHHTTGEYEDGRTPIPLSGLRFKLGKKPHMVTTLTLGADDSTIFVSVVKNRFGPRDPAGLRVRVPLTVQYEFMKMWDPPEVVT